MLKIYHGYCIDYIGGKSSKNKLKHKINLSFFCKKTQIIEKYKLRIAN